MTTIGYNNIEDISLALQDPNTGGATYEIPGVSSPKINGSTSIYNVEADGGIAGWSTDVSWSASDYNTVARSSGNINLPDGTTLSVSSGNTGNMSSTTYIYYDQSTGTVGTTTSAATSVGKDKILLCVAAPTSSGKDAEFQAFGCGDQSTFIHADNIAANTISANEIAANTITSTEIKSGAITTDKISSGAVTADKIDVNELSAIVAKLGDVYVGGSSGSKIRIYPYSSTAGRIEFYYNNSSVGSMSGVYDSDVGNAIGITGTNIVANGTLWCVGKLRIPVGTNLY